MYECPKCQKAVVKPVYIDKENCGHILCFKCAERIAISWEPCPGLKNFKWYKIQSTGLNVDRPFVDNYAL